MTNRREFLGGAGALAAASMVPSVASEVPALPTRPIPVSGEPMAVVGLGNSQAFRNGDVATSKQLLDTFLTYGGQYIDVSGSSRTTVGQIINEQGAQGVYGE